MSQPREVVPLATYLITRRILRRHFLLRPDAAITGIIVYALAVSSRLFGVEVHAICAMSNHLHLVVTDVQGVLPRFLQYFHRLVALATKVLRAWEGPLWEPGAVSAVRLLTPAAVVEKIGSPTRLVGARDGCERADLREMPQVLRTSAMPVRRTG
jgi:putative transposase